MSEDFIYVPHETELIPLPKSEYCTIKLSEYINLRLKEQRFDIARDLIRDKNYDSAFELILKGVD